MVKEKIRYLFVVMLLHSELACAWGARAHEITAKIATAALPAEVYKNCHISPSDIPAFVNDPDIKWKSQKFKFRFENFAHYFHVDRQPQNWKSRTSALDQNEGLLYYRILDWWREAKDLREKKQWDDLKVRLIGLSHYLGDLTQPLHLHSDHDGKGHGLKGLHSQFETKMIARYEKEIFALVKKKFTDAQIKKAWKNTTPSSLISSVSIQSFERASLVFGAGKSAHIYPQSKKKREKPLRPYFSKNLLWKNANELAASQLSLSAHLIEYVFTDICK